MEEREKTVKMMVAGSMSFDDPKEPVKAKVLEHFLYLVGTDSDLSDVQIYIAIDRLRQMLEESPSDTPRLLFGVELVSLLCDKRRLTVTIGVGRVLEQYAKVLTRMIRDRRLHFINCAEEDSKLAYELALDIAHVIALNASSNFTGTTNTLIREIVRRAPEEGLKAKLEQLESPDFREDDPENRAKFYDIFVIEYLKRFYGMNKVMKQLRYYDGVDRTVRIDVSGKRFCAEEVSDLWETLKKNCEITNPTQDQHLQRQLLTSELLRRHPKDGVVEKWYKDNFPELVRT